MGTIHDMKQRIESLRFKGFDSKWPEDVEMARKFIFEKGYSVTSTAVERVLAAKSWVPTRVCTISVTSEEYLTLLRIHL